MHALTFHQQVRTCQFKKLSFLSIMHYVGFNFNKLIYLLDLNEAENLEMQKKLELLNEILEHEVNIFTLIDLKF
jgi:hypothetical protein